MVSNTAWRSLATLVTSFMKTQPVPALYHLLLSYGINQTYLWCTSLSSEGLLILKHSAIENLSSVKLAIELHSGAVIKTEASVTEVLPEVGFKVRFASLEAQDQAQIARAVQAGLKELSTSMLFPNLSEQIVEKGEKRNEFRVAVSFDVQLESASSIQRGKVYDVSYSGAAVWSTRSLEVGEQVMVTGPNRRFKIMAIVRSSIPKDRYWRIGLQILQPSQGWVIAP